MQGLTAFQRDLLHVIAGLDDPPGLVIKKELDEYYDEEVISSRLYMNLDELVVDGLVQKGQYDDRTNAYIITEKGEQMINERAGWERQYYQPEPQPVSAGAGD
jgi:DNA-binding PadR family transcriptional regulator